MDLASIMVSVDLGAAAPDRIRLATHLATRFEAQLIGLAARLGSPPAGSGNPFEAIQVMDVGKAQAYENLSRANAVYERSIDGFVRASWRSDLAHPLSHLVRHSRAADVVVVGRCGTADPSPGPMDVLPGPLVIEAGRPVLVSPPGLKTLRIGVVVVAWKDTPQARRAVLHSIPFLERSDRVFVVAVSPEAEDDGAEDVAAYLSRHGVAVTAHLLRGHDLAASETLLRFVEREGADLLVMGAYGRSRLREWIFGGVTHEILQTTPVCCLLSN